MKLKKIRVKPEVEALASNDARVYTIKPMVKTFLRPCMSASLPKGNTRAALARVKAVGIHPKSNMFTASSFWIRGRIKLRDDPMKGISMEPMITRTNAYLSIGILAVFFVVESIGLLPAQYCKYSIVCVNTFYY